MNRGLLSLLAAATLSSCFADEAAVDPGGNRERLYIIGQDLGSVRDYYSSGCCPGADGNTAYLSFYDLLDEERGFGGLGIDRDGNPIDMEFEWGGGPANAWKSATEFGHGGLAIGLSIAEHPGPGHLDRLVAGDFDANIRQLARFISKIEPTVYLRIGYEFDGYWNPGYEDAARWSAAFRRIVDVLREENVSNVEYVWQGSAFPEDDLHDKRHENVLDWYPGDEYVDWIGLSVFMPFDEAPAIEADYDPPTARQLVGEVLALARERGKPVMIAEASPQGYDLARGTNANIGASWDGPQGEGRRTVTPDEIWKEWYAPVFEFMDQNRDVILAFAYINCHWDVQDMWDSPYENGYWGDSRLQASPEIADRFSRAIQKWKAGD